MSYQKHNNWPHIILVLEKLDRDSLSMTQDILNDYSPRDQNLLNKLQVHCCHCVPSDGLTESQLQVCIGKTSKLPL